MNLVEKMRGLVRPFTVFLIMPAVVAFTAMRVYWGLATGQFDQATGAFKDFLVVTMPVVFYYFRTRDEEKRNHAS